MAHSAIHHGLQAHSIGESYPWYIVHKGNRRQWYNGVTGELAGPWTTEPLPTCPPATAGEWVVRFRLGGESGYRARAYNIVSHQFGPLHTGADYYLVLAAALADLTALAADNAARDAVFESLEQIPLREFTILVPTVRGDNQRVHDPKIVNWWHAQLVDLAGGYTKGPYVTGCWVDDSGELVYDTSSPYVIAVSGERVGELRQLVRNACNWFAQDCIYCSETGTAELLS